MPKAKTFRQLTKEHSKELRQFASQLDLLLEEQKTVVGLQRHAVFANMIGYLQGAADAIKAWPSYFTEK